MNFDLSDEQRMMADQVRRLLQDHQPTARLRTLLAEDLAWDEPTWRELAALGVLGCSIPEAYGGLGLGEVETALIAGELGRAVAAVPFMSSIGLAAPAILGAGSDAQKASWLPQLASGEAVFTFAYAEGVDDVWSALPTCALSDGRLHGVKSPVADLGVADAAVVACESGGRPALALVELDRPGVQIMPLEGVDLLRRHGELRLDGAAAERLDGPDVEGALERVLDRAATLTAFEQVGGADACLELALTYVKQRDVFGRKLGSYQAIKHRLADLYVANELARSNAYYAVACADDPVAAPAAAAAARLSACEAFELAARESLQVHGGFGYTWEADCHFHLRRERLLRVALGGPDRWADRLLASLLGPRELSLAA